MTEKKLQRLSLRRNFSWSFLGNMVYAGCLWMMLVAMSKLLAVEKVGMFILATAIITPIEFFFNLQLRAVQGSDAKDEYQFGEYFALRILTVFFMVAAAMIASLLLGKGTEMIAIMAGVVLYKAADCYSDISYGLMQKYERLDKVAISRIVRGGSGVLVFTLVLYLTRNIALAFVAVAVVWAFVFAFSDLAAARHFEAVRPIFRKSGLVKLGLLSLPMGITMAVASLNSKIPSYFTERYYGSAELGYFGVLSYIVVALRTAISSISPSALPRLSHYYLDNHRGFIKLLAKMVLMAIIVGAVGILLGLFLGKPFLRLAYTADYTKHTKLFIWLLVAGGISYVSTMLCVGLTAARLFKVQVPLTLMVMVVLLTSCWVLIPKYGIIGAAWAMSAGFAAHALGALALILWDLYPFQTKT